MSAGRFINIAMMSMLWAILLAISGCVYIPDVQQGNVIHLKDIHKLHKGMAVGEVRAIMGNPVLEKIFADNSLVYVYTFRRNHQRRKERSLIIYFHDDLVDHYWTDYTRRNEYQ